MFGLLNLNKPAGKTSRDAVNLVSRLIRGVKVGHAGTLDPLATGVLVIGVGPATRLVQFVQRMPKRYEATFLLGKESDTEDIEGQVQEVETAKVPGIEDIRSAIPSFCGQIEQTPPAYSALKVRGRRAYDLARQGKQVELQPRSIVVYEIELVRYDYPELGLRIQCGSGTYIRSLGRDLARAVGSAAVMSQLTRTAIGSFRLEDAISPEVLTGEMLEERLIPAVEAVTSLPKIRVTDGEAERLWNGQRIADRWAVTGAEIAVVGERGELIAIATQEAGERIKPLRNFPPQEAPRGGAEMP